MSMYDKTHCSIQKRRKRRHTSPCEDRGTSAHFKIRWLVFVTVTQLYEFCVFCIVISFQIQWFANIFSCCADYLSILIVSFAMLKCFSLIQSPLFLPLLLLVSCPKNCHQNQCHCAFTHVYF